jgi:23S rRNA pseudouridine1911/1915/1917 synthase
VINTIKLTFTIPARLAHQRLDQALSALAGQYSRTLLQQWIKAGCVALDGAVVREQRRAVAAGQTIVVEAHTEERQDDRPQDIQLNVLYQDADIIVLNKPAGLVVHPGAGCKDGTMLNALLHYAPELAQLPRAGIIHRLDKDTSGVLVVARNLAAHKKLVDALQARVIKREYAAVVCGQIIAGGTIDAPIGRHQTKRTAMAVMMRAGGRGSSGGGAGREATTHYRVVQRFAHHTYLQVILETGRTHQIRVHMAHIGHPIVGDPVYGGRLRIPRNTSAALRDMLHGFHRQALHAAKLTLQHPRTGKEMEFVAPLPADMEQLLTTLHEAQRCHRAL